MKLVVTEKPSVLVALSRVIGATKRQDGYLEGNGYLVSWCIGHLVELSAQERYTGIRAAVKRGFDRAVFLWERTSSAENGKRG